MSDARTDKLLICASAQQATAACWRRGKIVRMERFARDAQGLAAFGEFLAQHRRTPVYMLADAAEEDYRIETLPHCSGAERRQLVARRLKQQYRDTPYAGACLEGRESSRRRDDRYLFCALTQPDLVDAWLRIIHGQALPVAGVYLLPMVASGLVKRLGVKAPNLLMVTRHTAGLRSTFLRDRAFRLSRVTRGATAKDADPARLMTGEIANSRLYLHALRILALDEQLTVLLIDPDDELDGVATAILHDNPALECISAGRAELSARLRMSAGHLASNADALYLQVLGLERMALDIAPAADTARYRRHRARKALHATCAAVASVAALSTVLNGWTAYGIHGRANEVAAQVVARDGEYRQIATAPSQSAVDGLTMKRAVEIEAALEQSARDPLRMMSELSRALHEHPEIVLREFGWAHGVADIQQDREAHGPAAGGESGVAPPARRQSAYVRAAIQPFHGHRAAIASIEAFAARIREQPHVAAVRNVKMPLDVRPTASLSGTLDAGGEPASAEFELVVSYRPGV
jgi:hypothetical protein